MKRPNSLFFLLFILIGALTWQVFKYSVRIHHARTDTTEDLFKRLPVKADDQVTIDKDIVPYFNIFLDDAEAHKCDVDRIYKVQFIKFSKQVERSGCQGVTGIFEVEDTIRGGIEFRENLMESDSLGFLFVVYHEFGHWLGLEHNDVSLMKESYNTREDSAWLKKNWVEIRNEYFEALNKHNKKETI